MAAVLHPAMKCGFAVSISSHEIAPVWSQPALSSGLTTDASCPCRVNYSVNTGGGSRGTGALRGAGCGSLQARRLSCSGSAAMSPIAPSVGAGSGSGDRLRTSGSWQLAEQRASGCCPIVAASASSKAALPNPSLKRTHNGIAVWPSSAGASPHFALAVQPTMPLRAA